LPSVPSVKIVKGVKVNSYTRSDKTKSTGIVVWIKIPGVPIKRVIKTTSRQGPVKSADSMGIVIIVLIEVTIGFIIKFVGGIFILVSFLLVIG